MAILSSNFVFSGYNSKNESALESQSPQEFYLETLNSSTSVVVLEEPFHFVGQANKVTHAPTAFITVGDVSKSPSIFEKYPSATLLGSHQLSEIYVSLIDEINITVLDNQNYVLVQSSGTTAIFYPFWN